MHSQSDTTLVQEFTAENVRVPNENGELEAILAYPSQIEPVCAVVIAGPHPLLGGDMQNNVVESLANGLAMKGFVTLRFNYAGVGMSDGPDFHSPENLKTFWQLSHTDDEEDRWKDLDSAVRFVRAATGNSLPLGIAAYSFGNYVTASWLANSINGPDEHKPAWIFCVAPTVDKHDMRGLAASKATKLVIAPSDDFATPIQALTRETGNWTPSVETIITERDGHFFRGHERWLSQQCFQFSSEFFPLAQENL